jgi:hypothetical protein
MLIRVLSSVGMSSRVEVALLDIELAAYCTEP